MLADERMSNEVINNLEDLWGRIKTQLDAIMMDKTKW